MKKKVVSLVLAIVMVFSCVPFAALAADKDDAERVEGWNANYALLEDKLLDSTSYAHYRYTVDNDEDIQKTMAVYTAFGLYDGALKNAIDKKADIKTCKLILLSMIEKYHVEMGKDYVAEIQKILGYAQTAKGLVEKLNSVLSKYTDALNFVNSETWTKIFQVVDGIQKAGNIYQDVKGRLVEAYARIMSIQVANGYYIEMLQYIADNVQYAPMKAAASQMVREGSWAVEDQLIFMVNEALDGQYQNAISTLLDLALDSNVYTATAKKVFNIIGKVTDILWNTKEQYPLFSQLEAAYYAEQYIDDYAAWAFDSADALYDPERTTFAVNALISVRWYGESALYQLKVAQCGGIVGKVKSQLNNYIFTEYTANMAELELMKSVFFDTAVNEMVPIKKIVKVYCPVSVTVTQGISAYAIFRLPDGMAIAPTRYGNNFAAESYSSYNKDYVKVLFLDSTENTVAFTGTGDGYMTYVEYVSENGELKDYSYTEAEVRKGDYLEAYDKQFTYTEHHDDGSVKEVTVPLNTEFKIPEGKTFTSKEIADATGEVIKKEGKSFLDKIRDLFKQLIDAIKKLFTIKKK